MTAGATPAGTPSTGASTVPCAKLEVLFADPRPWWLFHISVVACSLVSCCGSRRVAASQPQITVFSPCDRSHRGQRKRTGGGMTRLWASLLVRQVSQPQAGAPPTQRGRQECDRTREAPHGVAGDLRLEAGRLRRQHIPHRMPPRLQLGWIVMQGARRVHRHRPRRDEQRGMPGAPPHVCPGSRRASPTCRRTKAMKSVIAAKRS
jgi:hypothetical protein